MRLFVQEAAENDVLGQIEWYAEHGLPHIARQFPIVVRGAVAELATMPLAGSLWPNANPQLVGMRRWPVKGFSEAWIYYLTAPELLTVVRVLHSKRDLVMLMKAQSVEKPPG